VGSEVRLPLLEIFSKGRDGAERDIVRSRSRVQLGEHLGEDTRETEKGQGARQLCGLSWEGRQESLLGDVFVIGVGWVFTVYVFFP
jgi:hypothetical protein